MWRFINIVLILLLSTLNFTSPSTAKHFTSQLHTLDSRYVLSVSNSSQPVQNYPVIKFENIRPKSVLTRVLQHNSDVLHFNVKRLQRKKIKNLFKHLRCIDRPLLIVINETAGNLEKIFVLEKGKVKRVDVENPKDNVSELMAEILSKDTKNTTLLFDSVKAKCNICMRVLHTFRSNYTDTTVINQENAKKYSCNAQCSRYLLNLPFNYNFAAKPSDPIKFFNNSIIYIKHISNILRRDLRANDTEFSEDLERKTRFQSFPQLAWSQKTYMIFNYLIRSDYPYPQNFSLSEVTQIKGRRYATKLTTFVRLIDEFHKHIKEGNVQKVEKFIAKNPNIRYARNLQNKSARKVAFDSKQWRIYALLKSKGYLPGSVEEVKQELMKTKMLTSEEKEAIRNFSYDYLVRIEGIDGSTAVDNVLRKFKVNFDSKMYSMEFIRNVTRKGLENINEDFPELIQVIYLSKDAVIVGDFESTTTGNVNPKAWNAQGYYNRTDNTIVLGLRNLLFNKSDSISEVLSTMAHEFTHLVMEIIYDNDSKPYKSSDNKSADEFSKIVEDLKNIKDEEKVPGYELISIIFENYTDSEFHSELIAKVPEIDLRYKDLECTPEDADEINSDENTEVNPDENPEDSESKDILSDLFNYYHTKVKADIDRKLKSRTQH